MVGGEDPIVYKIGSAITHHYCINNNEDCFLIVFLKLKISINVCNSIAILLRNHHQYHHHHHTKLLSIYTLFYQALVEHRQLR
jgi:hypothetical protein